MWSSPARFIIPSFISWWLARLLSSLNPFKNTGPWARFVPLSTEQTDLEALRALNMLRCCLGDTHTNQPDTCPRCTDMNCDNITMMSCGVFFVMAGTWLGFIPQEAYSFEVVNSTDKRKGFLFWLEKTLSLSILPTLSLHLLSFMFHTFWISLPSLNPPLFFSSPSLSRCAHPHAQTEIVMLEE